MEEIEYKIKEALLQDIEIPNSYKNMIHSTLKNKKGVKNMKEKIKKFIISILAIILGTGGFCLAGVKVYNEYIRKQESIVSKGLFEDEKHISTYESDLRINDMKYNKELDLYYKVINNSEDYLKYKNRITSIPEMTEDELEKNFIIIVTWAEKRQLSEIDMEINRIDIKNNDTYVILKQKENPNYNSKNNVLIAVVSKEKLKENMKIEIEYQEIDKRDFKDAKELSSNYTVKEAIADGCFVIENNEVKSKDKNSIDKLISNAENKKNGYIRVYNKKNNQNEKAIYIYDVEFKNGLYYVESTKISDINSKTKVECYKKLTKTKNVASTGIMYMWIEDKIMGNQYDSTPFLIIKNIEM